MKNGFGLLDAINALIIKGLIRIYAPLNQPEP